MNIKHCINRLHFGYNGHCVQNDEIKEIKGSFLNSDLIVFGTPLYYYGKSA